MDNQEGIKKKKKKTSDEFEKQFESDDEEEILADDEDDILKESDDEYDYDDGDDTDIESIISDTDSCISRASESTLDNYSGHIDYLEEEDISD